MHLPGWPCGWRGISLKLALWTALLVAIVTLGSSLAVLETVEENLAQEMIRRGRAISLSVATPAAFSILADDLLALDNLAAKVVQAEDDLLYLAIVDTGGKILAHSRFGQAGALFSPAAGKLLLQQDELTVTHTAGTTAYEFRTPVLFNGRQVGAIYLGVGDNLLQAFRRQMHRKIGLHAAGALLLGVVGALLLAGVFTRPIKRLSKGVAALQAGGCAQVPVRSGDELGRLTSEFNTMAEQLTTQKASLAEHARQLEEAYLSTVRLLAAAIDARDEYTLGHSTRVANLSILLGRRLGLSEPALRDLSVACFLHDVGKIRIPDRILHKRGPLNAVEHGCIVKHPEHGAAILRLAESLQHYVPAVLHHHERWDGRGYPAGLRGEEIPLFAAILAVTDAYDAMTSSRPYRAGLSREQAIAELKRCSGSQFAPHLVEAFVTALDGAPEDPQPAILAGVA